MNYRHAIIIFVVLSAELSLGTPNSLTFQGRILKSDGTPLEFNNVSFLFEITNPTGSCVIYREQKDAVNMVNSKGVFDVPIGAGTKYFPTSPTKTLLSIFSNSQTLDCADPSNNPSGTYAPAVDDIRRLRVQFHDGMGWKVISPDSEIRSVPYSAFSLTAQSALTLGTKTENDFLLKAGLPTCVPGTFLSYHGAVLTCDTVSGASGGTVTNVTSANTDINVTSTTSTPLLTLNSGVTGGAGDANKIAKLDDSGLLASAMIPSIPASKITSGNLGIANGGTGATTDAGARTNLGLGTVATLNTGSSSGDIPVIGVSGITANKMCTTDGTSSVICNSNIPVSSQWTTAGSNIYYSSGNVGIGTTTPARLLHVNGPMRLQPATLPGSPASGDIAIDSGASNALKYYNGSAWSSLSPGGSGSSGNFRSIQFNQTGTFGGNSYLTFDELNNRINVGNDVSGTSAGIFFRLSGGVIGTYVTASGPGTMTIATGYFSRITILPSGEVGVGNSTPTYKLDVTGDINSTTRLRIAGTEVCTAAGCTSSSDRRLKENIQPLTDSFQKILRLQGVEYDYLDKEKFGSAHQIGVIAQDVEKFFPEVVKTDSNTGFKSVAYDHLVAPLIEAVKSLYRRVVELENQQTAQARQIASIEKSKADKADVEALRIENQQFKTDNRAKDQEIRELQRRLDKLEKILLTK